MDRPAGGRLFVTFVAGRLGAWKIERLSLVKGESLTLADRLDVIESGVLGSNPPDAAWSLTGVTSNQRYSKQSELAHLREKQESLGRRSATRAALIPIRKTDAWWALAQDVRREIFEETSRHIVIGMEYLPGIARRLHHSRDLGVPFDFLTWFEFAPDDEGAFEELVVRLRGTPEWNYVEREVDIRLSRFPLE